MSTNWKAACCLQAIGCTEAGSRVVIARFPAPRLWLILMISVATFRLLPRRRDGMRLDLRHYLYIPRIMSLINTFLEKQDIDI
ncbi:hypothetical protein P692DRAFT_20832174 [Suillus brevipes Sb2]|nr:hypothetical protein P692DRAFT_20832174 [Suillus brevipes Sb2]